MRDASLNPSFSVSRLAVHLTLWGACALYLVPLLVMLLTSFKSEIDAFATPPQFIFQPTLENYLHINERSDYFAYAWNSLLISSSATLLCMLVAVPAAYSMAFFETRHTKRTLLWMLSTKMLPPVGVLMPIYLLAKQFGLPIRYIGVGEGIDDLRTFEADAFVQALFAERENA